MTADLERSDFNPAIPKEVVVVTLRYFLFISVGGSKFTLIRMTCRTCIPLFYPTFVCKIWVYSGIPILLLLLNKNCGYLLEPPQYVPTIYVLTGSL